MREGSDTFSDKFFQGCHFYLKINLLLRLYDMFQHKLFFFVHDSIGENHSKKQNNIAFINMCVNYCT